ncbi:RagB/SusD family nutrient uptake outer membrane protein [Nubsella zeaxanthinifaciens]|uniref:RagB/SusD family nutrient uptake outer membrane protein n=1 Tax=Nubsella zeaxanthinifaciens TaxID=392412 RepID=UPI003D010DB5
MKHIKIYFILVTVALCFACNKVLDIDAGKYIILEEDYYKTEEQLNAALRGAYATLADGSLFGNNLLGRMGLEADEGYESYSSDLNTVGDYNVYATDSKILGYYRVFYRGINRANLLLESVDDPTITITAKERNHIKGQALFLRGYFHFMLANKFGGVPLMLKATRSDAVKTEDLQKPRTALKDVYAAVLNDLKSAVDLLKPMSEVNTGTQASKSAAWAMLARVSLYMAGQPLNDASKYAEAAEWAKKVKDANYHALNPSYEKVFVNYATDVMDPKESIFEVDFYGNGTGIYASTGGMVGRNNGIAYPLDSSNVGYGIGAIRSTSYLYNLYTTGDTRRDWAIAPYYYTGTPRVKTNWTAQQTTFARYSGKFRRESEILLPKSSASTPQNYPLMRYSDVLLMYAEALNEMPGGDKVLALEQINVVRRRAIPVGSPDRELTVTDYTGLKDAIIEERARELCFEGLRKNDLVRWGIFTSSMQSLNNQVPIGTSSYIISARAYYGNAKPRDVVWPIPTYEMTVNRLLTQNVGW